MVASSNWCPPLEPMEEQLEVETRRQVCVELDRVLVELMDCLERLATLRGRLSREVSEVSLKTTH